MFTKLILAAALSAAPALAFAGGGHTHGSDDTASMGQKDDGAMMEKMVGDAPLIHDAYARAATPNARSGAAFMMIMNPTDTDDRLIAARSDVSARVELHTHIMDDNGVMQMREVEDGFMIPAGGSYMLERGGDHVMFMGLKESFTQGKEIPVTLVFEKAGEIETTITVDLERRDEMGHSMDHGSMNHGGVSN